MVVYVCQFLSRGIKNQRPFFSTFIHLPYTAFAELNRQKSLRLTGNLLCESGVLKLGLCNNLEGWGVMGGEREGPEGGDMCIPMGD